MSNIFPLTQKWTCFDKLNRKHFKSLTQVSDMLQRYEKDWKLPSNKIATTNGYDEIEQGSEISAVFHLNNSDSKGINQNVSKIIIHSWICIITTSMKRFALNRFNKSSSYVELSIKLPGEHAVNQKRRTSQIEFKSWFIVGSSSSYGWTRKSWSPKRHWTRHLKTHQLLWFTLAWNNLAMSRQKQLVSTYVKWAEMFHWQKKSHSKIGKKELMCWHISSAVVEQKSTSARFSCGSRLMLSFVLYFSFIFSIFWNLNLLKLFFKVSLHKCDSRGFELILSHDFASKCKEVTNFSFHWDSNSGWIIPMKLENLQLHKQPIQLLHEWRGVATSQNP